MTEQTNNSTNAAASQARKGPKPMRYGRAMKLDLGRASDETLAEAYAFLDAYDTAGKASAWVQEDIDERLQAIDDEGDRRAGIEPVYVPRQPTMRERWEAANKAGAIDDAQDAVQEPAHDEGAPVADLLANTLQ